MRSRYLPHLTLCTRRFFRTRSSTKEEHARPVNVMQTEDVNADRFFSYTSGRWIHNEKHQLSLRYRRFNVDALKEVVARAGGGKDRSRDGKVSRGGAQQSLPLQA